MPAEGLPEGVTVEVHGEILIIDVRAERVPAAARLILPMERAEEALEEVIHELAGRSDELAGVLRRVLRGMGGRW
jgi:hypothetical protein